MIVQFGDTSICCTTFPHKTSTLITYPPVPRGMWTDGWEYELHKTLQFGDSTVYCNRCFTKPQPSSLDECGASSATTNTEIVAAAMAWNHRSRRFLQHTAGLYSSSQRVQTSRDLSHHENRDGPSCLHSDDRPIRLECVGCCVVGGSGVLHLT